MGLLDSLFDQNTYGGQGGGLLDFLRTSQMQQNNYQPSPGFPDQQPSPLDNAQWPAGPQGAPSAPASFADRFNAMPGAPPAFAPSGRSFDTATFDPQTYAPNQAQPINVGNYQMPRMGSADQFSPAMNAQAQIPPNAQPTQGQLPPQQAPMQAPQQQTAPTFLSNEGGLGAGLRGFVNNLHTGPLGAIIGGLGNAAGMQSSAQQNQRAQYHALISAGLSPQNAMLAILNPEAGKTLINEALTNKEKYQKTGVDALGNETYGFVNEREQTINGKALGAGEGGNQSAGFLAPGVKQIDSSLTGQDYLKQFSPEVQAAVQNYVDGKSMPTGNPRKGFTQTVKMIAQKYGADTNQPVDDATYSARRTMRNQLSSSAPSSLGGQINIGNTAAGHLADLTEKALDLNNKDIGWTWGSHVINEARGLNTAQAAKMEALKGAAQHYGQEITKFYAGSPGGVAERDRFIESVGSAKTPQELAAILATEGELMRDRLNALGGQIKGVLGDEGLQQYPVLRPSGQTALSKVEENVSRLRSGQGAAASGGFTEGQTATNPKTGATLTFRNGKWQ